MHAHLFLQSCIHNSKARRASEVTTLWRIGATESRLLLLSLENMTRYLLYAIVSTSRIFI